MKILSIWLVLFALTFKLGWAQSQQYHNKLVRRRRMESSYLNKFPDQTLTFGEDLKPEDFIAGQQLSKMQSDDTPRSGEDPLLKAGKFEGDIDLGGRPIQEFVDHFERGDKHSGQATPPQRNAIRGQHYRWPNGVVPFNIAAEFGRYERSAIAAAVQEYNEKTCIKWKPRTTEQDYVYIVKRDGCYSSVGKMRGPQQLSIGVGCGTKGIVIHEMMHAIGFYHEQSRTDRDDYVTVLWDNIQDWAKYNFDKYGVNKIDDLGTRYDYDSIMHYDSRSFSKTRFSETIVPKNRNARIGQRRGLSKNDAKKINLLYNCANTGGTGGGTGGGGTKKVIIETKCLNYNAHCDAWAQRNYCVSYKDFMQKVCQAACGFCSKGITESGCTDDEKYCDWYRRHGFCKSFSTYMNKNCKKSCNIC